MNNGKSEIDASTFFLAKDGKNNADEELKATLEALYNENSYDDNSTACLFPARTAWLKSKLKIDDLVKVTCKEYDETLKKLDPKSLTFIFPSAHINSPASMFGHTFLRINSSYKSRLLSYAVNYAADVNEDETSGMAFAIKGLFGGYMGKYSLMHYYEKLKEYRDTEQRDIWEYDLNFSKEEILLMVRHLWELNNSYSDYYFFTENCSYNMLWLLEIARPSLKLREHFSFQVAPLETIHVSKEENIILKSNYRASKRTKLLKYEKLIDEKYIHFPRELINEEMKLKELVDNKEIELQQKMYILEASIEFLEYSFSKNDMNKNQYMELFHNISKARASLGKGEKLNIQVPANPLNSHRAIRTTFGYGKIDAKDYGFIGIRPVYHSLYDAGNGFLRGTQIEFLSLLLNYSNDEIGVYDATLLSIASLAQRSEFFDSLSWRTKFGWDNDYLSERTNFIGSIGVGYSWGNESAYFYLMADPLFYYENKEFKPAISSSIGIVIDKNKNMNTNIQVTKRLYENSKKQLIANISQSFRLSQNYQLRLNYDFKEKYYKEDLINKETYKVFLNYYF